MMLLLIYSVSLSPRKLNHRSLYFYQMDIVLNTKLVPARITKREYIAFVTRSFSGMICHLDGICRCCGSSTKVGYYSIVYPISSTNRVVTVARDCVGGYGSSMTHITIKFTSDFTATVATLSLNQREARYYTHLTAGVKYALQCELPYDVIALIIYYCVVLDKPVLYNI